MFGIDLGQIISNVIGSIIMMFAVPLTLAMGGVTYLLLKLMAVLFGFVFYIAYMFLTGVVVLDFGQLIGFGSFPSPDMLKPTADYWHIYIIISDNTDYYTILQSTNTTFAPASTAVGGKATVVLLPSLFGVAKGLFNSLMVLIAVVMIMRIMYEYLKIEPRDIYQDLELLARKSIEIVFGLVVIMILIPGVLGLVSILPVKIGDYAWNTLGFVRDSEGNVRNVIDYSVNAVADLYISGISDYLSAVGSMFTGGGGVDVGTAISYSILLPLFTIGVLFIIGATLIGILVAPVSLFVKRLVLSFFSLVMYPVFLLITYVGELLSLAGRGIGNFGGGILDNIVNEFAGALNSFSNLMTMYIRHVIGTSIGIPIFLFALRLTGEIAVAFQSGGFITEMIEYGKGLVNKQAGLTGVYVGVQQISVVNTSPPVSVPSTAEEYLMKSLIKFMVAFSMFVVIAMLFSKLEQIDQPGSILEFGRLQAVVSQGLMTGLSLSLAGLALPLGGAGVVLGKAVALGGVKLALAGHRIGMGIARLGTALAYAGASIPAMVLGTRGIGVAGIPGIARSISAPGEVAGKTTVPAGAGAPVTTGEKTTGTRETVPTESEETIAMVGEFFKSLKFPRKERKLRPFGISSAEAIGVYRAGRGLEILEPIKRTGKLLGAMYGSIMLAGTGMALSQVARLFLGERAGSRVSEIFSKHTSRILERGVLGGFEAMHKRMHVVEMFRDKNLLNRELIKKLRVSDAGLVSVIENYKFMRKLERVSDAMYKKYEPLIKKMLEMGKTPSEIVKLIEFGTAGALGIDLAKAEKFRTMYSSIVKKLARRHGLRPDVVEKIIAVYWLSKIHGIPTREILKHYAMRGDVSRSMYSYYMKMMRK